MHDLAFLIISFVLLCYAIFLVLLVLYSFEFLPLIIVLLNLKGLHHPGPMSGMGTTHGYVNRMYPNKPYGQYGTTFRSGMGFGSNGYDLRMNERGWLADNKYRPRGRGNGYFGSGNDIMDGFNELNRGPRAKGPKNQKGATPITAGTKGQNIPSYGTKDEEKEKAYVVPDREQYNLEEFPVDYDSAKFFVIKSYSEDDVHKSIKYNVWASTPNGNKKLDAAYQEAQQKSGHCPIFLFFSVGLLLHLVYWGNLFLVFAVLNSFELLIGQYKWAVCRYC